MIARSLAIILMVTVSVPAGAQNNTSPAAPSNTAARQNGSAISDLGKKAGEIVTQPARDVGAVQAEIPPVLQAASQGPYSLRGVNTCAQISADIARLTEVLGPDFTAGAAMQENRAGRVAEAGGRTIVNTIIPFRGLVRELTGAAPAQRRLNAAIDAGQARRGFLHGLQRARRCKTTF
jgi:hypothetical protein